MSESERHAFWTAERDAELRRLRESGHSLLDISVRLGFNPSGIRRRCRQLKIEVLHPRERHQSRPLTPEQVREVEAAVLAGKKTAAQVAAEIGATVQQVAHRMVQIRARLGVPTPRRPPARIVPEHTPHPRRLDREPRSPHLVGVPQISDRLAVTYDHLLTHEDRVEISQTIAAACAVLRQYYQRRPGAAM